LDLANELINKIEFNYVGYKLLTKNGSESSYIKAKQTLIQSANKLDSTYCIIALNKFASYFNDNHFAITRDKVINLKNENELSIIGNTLKSKLRGKWFNQNRNMAIIIKEEKSNQLFGYSATVTKHYKKGELLFKVLFYNNEPYFWYCDSTYEYQYIKEVQIINSSEIRLDKRERLSKKMNRNLINQGEPSKSVYFKEINSKTAYISLPSFDYEYREMIDSILNKNDSIIRQKQLFIIDIRNNGGGGVEPSYGLVQYYDEEKIIYPFAYDISTDSSIANLKRGLKYLSRDSSSKDFKFYRFIMNQMILNKGNLILDTSETILINTIKRKPANIAILINGKTASAAELFLLAKPKSKNVKFFGSPTAGTVDFGWPINFLLHDPTYNLSIPSQMTDHVLIQRLENIGIKPDIDLSQSKRNWVSDILKYYKIPEGLSF
jgi:hypothetical protein